MTSIEKPVFRVTRGAYPVLHHSSRRQVVVGLECGDVLTFREKGRRRRFSVPIDSAFRWAIRCQVEADRRQKREVKKLGGR